MLPGLNGFEVLRRLRDKSRIPVLLLTARGEDVDRIVGLEIGADDYLPKPFNPRSWWLVFAPFCAGRELRTAREADSRLKFCVWVKSNSIRPPEPSCKKASRWS